MPLTPQQIADHEKKTEQLLKETHAGDGLAPVDLERFWAENEIAVAEPFGDDIPHMPFAASCTGQCVFDELGVEEDHWRYQNDVDWRLELNKAYNDKAERIVGRRLLGEQRPDETLQYPATKGLHDVFEAENVWHDQSWWLQQSADTEDELAALLDRVERRLENLREFILPENWETERDRLMAAGVKPRMYRGQRGPCTFATSIYGAENMLFLTMDNPELTTRLRDLILRAMLGIAAVLDEEAGYTPETAPRGFTFLDDNSALFNPEMYELFGFPILKGVFDRYAPDPEDWRYQHSDSDMGHLVPILARLNLHAVNFGPNVMADYIHEHMPRTVVQGVLAPFTYSFNDERGMVMELLRDHELTRETRGIHFATAGSVNNGSRLTGMRLMMAATQRYARYD